MLCIVLATADYAACTALAERLEHEPGTEFIPVGSAAAALQVLTEKSVQLLIAAEQLEDCSGLACVRQVAARFPLVYTALCSGLGPEAFHEATEGLGVLLQLPLQPGRRDAERIIERMAHIDGLLRGPDQRS